MDNKKLYEKFFLIKDNNNNPFNLFLALKSFKKEYKKSIFYKKTHLNVYKAYKIFLKVDINQKIDKFLNLADLKYAVKYLSDVIDNVAPEKIEELSMKIVESFDFKKIEQYKGELKEAINKITDER